MSTDKYPLNDPQSYIRVQYRYYKKSITITAHGIHNEVLLDWSTETLKQDKVSFAQIPKYDSFFCIPNHINYQRVLGNLYNRYQPLKWQPEEGDCTTITEFLKHIFGEQYQLGLDYLTLLYKLPIQQLPILCLVSKERKTGKSTFLNLLKHVFGANMTFNRNSDLGSRFNSDWADKVINAFDEVYLPGRADAEKIKNLATAQNTKLESKNKDKIDADFFGKFIFCTNNEIDFIHIDQTETRYWVLKIPPFKSEKVDLLGDMEKEIPHFLHMLSQRTLTVPAALTRMWFSEDQICTDALLKIKGVSKNSVETEILLTIKEVMETLNLNTAHFTNGDLIDLVKKKLPRLSKEETTCLLKAWKLTSVSNTLRYHSPECTISDQLLLVSKRGRYYTFDLVWVKEKLDAIAVNQSKRTPRLTSSRIKGNSR